MVTRISGVVASRYVCYFYFLFLVAVGKTPGGALLWSSLGPGSPAPYTHAQLTCLLSGPEERRRGAQTCLTLDLRVMVFLNIRLTPQSLCFSHRPPLSAPCRILPLRTRVGTPLSKPHNPAIADSELAARTLDVLRK